MSERITRQRMVDMMERRFQATLQERNSRNWRRVNAVVFRQEDVSCRGVLDFHLVELCLDGRVRVGPINGTEQGDGVSADIVPGSLSHMQCDTPQEFRIDGQYTVLQMYIDRTIFDDTASSLNASATDLAPALGFQGVFEPRLKALAEALLEEARNPSAGGDLYVDALAQQMAVLILRRQQNAPPAEQKRRKLSAEEISRVSDYLRANLADPGGMDTLANILGMDVFGFTRAFRETTGQAPHQYLIERRIARAKEMLLEDREPLAEIAYATGFSSQSHMTTAFTKRVGTSPGKWRAAVKDGQADPETES